VLRPVLRSLVSESKSDRGDGGAVALDMAAGEGGGLGEDRLSLTPQAAGGAPLEGYDAHLANARQVAQADPKRVAQVVKSWVNEE
jgi:flagellar M-ring protein FliF